MQKILGDLRACADAMRDIWLVMFRCARLLGVEECVNESKAVLVDTDARTGLGGGLGGPTVMIRGGSRRVWCHSVRRRLGRCR